MGTSIEFKVSGRSALGSGEYGHSHDGIDDWFK